MVFSIASCLEQAKKGDPDLRFMGLTDLLKELENNESFRLSKKEEQEVCSRLVELFADPSGDVRTLAVKCLSPLMLRISNNSVESVCSSLADLLLNPKEVNRQKRADGRDIAATGLNGAIRSAPPEHGPLIVKQLADRLLERLCAKGPAKGSNERELQDEQKHSLDVLAELLGRFGPLLNKQHTAIQEAVLPQLTSPQPQPRKLAITALGHLASFVSAEHFSKLVAYLNSQAEEAVKPEDARTYVQAIGNICLCVGPKMGVHLAQVFPTVETHVLGEKFISLYDSTSENFEGDAELRETALQCLEAFVTRCPKDVGPHVPRIVELALVYIKHDPNYTEDLEGEGDSMVDEEDDFGWDEDFDDGEIGAENEDSDDMNWKVRRACSKLLAAIISTRSADIDMFYEDVAPKLVARFTEREENVKLDVFNTFHRLLIATKDAANSKANAALKALVPEMITSLTPQLTDKTKNERVRISAFKLLRNLLAVVPSALAGRVAEFIPGISFGLTDVTSSSQLKSETLAFVRICIDTHSPSEFHSDFAALSEGVYQAVNESFYKIVAEALRVCSSLVSVLCEPSDGFDPKPFIAGLYGACHGKLVAQDIDQEVKEAAIECGGLIVAKLGDKLEQTPECLGILSERLLNEITRLPAVRALGLIAASPLHLDLGAVLQQTMEQLSAFLRQNSRKIKHASLVALNTIVTHYASDPAVKPNLPAAVSELSAHVSPADLHLAHLALKLATAVLKADPSMASNIKADVFPNSMELLKSQLLQGLTLESLLGLFGSLVDINMKGFGFDYLFETLLKLTATALSKQCLQSVSQSVAICVVHASDKQRDAAVAKFLKDIKSGKDLLFALQCLGEIGRRTDLTSCGVMQQLFDALDNPAEELKSAASVALGKLAVGNVAVVLPALIDNIQSHSNRQYLLVVSLREMIVRLSTTDDGVKVLEPTLEQLLPLFFTHCESSDEGTRNVVAECLGKLALVQPGSIIPQLQEKLLADGSHANSRATVVTAMKFAVVERAHVVDAAIDGVLASFLERLRTEDTVGGLAVKHAVLLLLNYLAHNKPALVSHHLKGILPAIYIECKPHQELRREVTIGPFKHIVDDGLESRKAAFECLHTLLEACPGSINVSELIHEALAPGLGDNPDIKLLSHLILTRLARSRASVVLVNELAPLLPMLKSTIEKKCKQNEVKQDRDRNEETINSALRAVLQLTKTAGIEAVPEFDEFMNSVIQGEIKEKFENVAAAASGMDDLRSSRS